MKKQIHLGLLAQEHERTIEQTSSEEGGEEKGSTSRGLTHIDFGGRFFSQLPAQVSWLACHVLGQPWVGVLKHFLFYSLCINMSLMVCLVFLYHESHMVMSWSYLLTAAPMTFY